MSSNSNPLSLFPQCTFKSELHLLDLHPRPAGRVHFTRDPEKGRVRLAPCSTLALLTRVTWACSLGPQGLVPHPAVGSSPSARPQLPPAHPVSRSPPAGAQPSSVEWAPRSISPGSHEREGTAPPGHLGPSCGWSWGTAASFTQTHHGREATAPCLGAVGKAPSLQGPWPQGLWAPAGRTWGLVPALPTPERGHQSSRLEPAWAGR